MDRKEQILRQIEMLRDDIFMTEMSEDSFEPYTQASQYIRRKREEIEVLKKELEALENETL